jgi:hypothetical protein
MGRRDSQDTSLKMSPPPTGWMLRVCLCLDAIPEATDMKEAMEIMPETMEYGVINSQVLQLLKDVICQVTAEPTETLASPRQWLLPKKGWRVH